MKVNLWHQKDSSYFKNTNVHTPCSGLNLQMVHELYIINSSEKQHCNCTTQNPETLSVSTSFL